MFRFRMKKKAEKALKPYTPYPLKRNTKRNEKKKYLQERNQNEITSMRGWIFVSRRTSKREGAWAFYRHRRRRHRRK